MRKGAESQGRRDPGELAPKKRSCHAPGLGAGDSTHPAEMLIVKGFGEEQTQQLQLALVEHGNTVRVHQHHGESAQHRAGGSGAKLLVLPCKAGGLMPLKQQETAHFSSKTTC